MMIQSDPYGDIGSMTEKVMITPPAHFDGRGSNKSAQIVTEEPKGRLGPDGNRTDSVKA